MEIGVLLMNELYLDIKGVTSEVKIEEALKGLEIYKILTLNDFKMKFELSTFFLAYECATTTIF